MNELFEQLEIAMKRNPDLDIISVITLVTNRKCPTRALNRDWKLDNEFLLRALKDYNKTSCV